MRYLGGKSRLAKHIVKAILDDTDSRSRWVEPFVGGGSVFFEAARNFGEAFGADMQEDLILMWQGLLSGEFTPPMNLLEDEWRELRDAEPSALRGFAGFGCSFGGRFFEGYARNIGGTNYASQSARSILSDLEKIGDSVCSFANLDYLSVEYRDSDVIYFDPPYAKTKHYSSKRSGVGKFNHHLFWESATELAKSGADVYVSEFEAPDDWIVMWEKDRNVGVGVQSGANYSKKTDKLFKWDGGA